MGFGTRRPTVTANVGGVLVGSPHPVVVQSMTKTETADVEATLRQIRAVADAGGDLIRCAVPRVRCRPFGGGASPSARSAGTPHVCRA